MDTLDDDVIIPGAVGWFVTSCVVATVVTMVPIYLYMVWQYKKSFWHHGVRLPNRPDQTHWYKVTMSVGCRPWAGHEGDIYLRLVGSIRDSNTFLVNREVHSRIYEADSHISMYSSAADLGQINYVIVACSASKRLKTWYLSSVHVKYVTEDPDQEKTWYFPYHEWIEVFLDPVKVTLCGVDPQHDLNRRIILGWMSRAMSDFHLWISMCGPLKYSTFLRSERFVCVGAHITSTIGACVLLNSLVPEFGPLVLGVYSSTIAAIPVYVLEWFLRMTERKPRVICEDYRWYKEGAGSYYPPVAYEQYRLGWRPKEKLSSLVCPKYNGYEGERLLEFNEHEGIITSKNVFWKWLLSGAVVAKSLTTIASSTTAEKASVAPESIKDEPTPPGSHISVDKPSGFFGRLVKKILPVYAPPLPSSPSSSEEEEIVEEVLAAVIYPSPPPTLSLPSIIQEKVDDDFNIILGKDTMDILDETQDITIKKAAFKKVNIPLGDGFEGEPTSVWKVDSNFSIESLEMDQTDFSTFVLIESMPVSEFDSLRKGRRPLLGNNAQDNELEYLDGDTAHVPKHLDAYRNLVRKTSDISLPTSAEHASNEEGELISMVFFDLNTDGGQWTKKGVPDSVYESTGVKTSLIPPKDVYRLQMTANADNGLGVFKEGPVRDFGEMTDENIRKRHEILSQEHQHPEPIPRLRIFSMLMFPEYGRKLADCYSEMLKDPEMCSSVAQMFAIFSESYEAPRLFMTGCLEFAKFQDGRKVLCNFFGCSKSSPAWTTLILDAAQRLRYQGDNIARLQEKFGLKTMCYSGENKRCFETNKVGFSSDLKGGSNQCVYDEMDSMLVWNQKLKELGIPDKDCPLGELGDKELRKLSAFFRHMIVTEQASELFVDILLQIIQSSEEGRELIGRIIKYVTSSEHGLRSLIAFHRLLGEVNKEGRRTLLRMYNAVKAQGPNGVKVLTRLTEHMGDLTYGKMLISDLQIDGLRAHMVARQIRDEIKSSVDPFIERISWNVAHIVMRMNDMAQHVLDAADHARSILEGKEDVDKMLELIKDKSPEEEHDNNADGDNEMFDTKFTCCKNYKDLVKQIDEKAGPATPPPVIVASCSCESFKYSPSSTAITCERQKDDRLVSELWQPVDTRGKVNIYQSEKEIPLHPCKGVEPPCRYNVYCQAKITTNYNQFYLESKDHEKFYMNFKYRPSQHRIRLKELNSIGAMGAVPTRSEESIARSTARMSRLKTVAGKWGRIVELKGESDISLNGEDLETIPSCTCTHVGDKGDDSYGCGICSIGDQLSKAETSKDFVNVITDNTENVPQISNQNLPIFPDYGDVKIKKDIILTKTPITAENRRPKCLKREKVVSEKLSEPFIPGLEWTRKLKGLFLQEQTDIARLEAKKNCLEIKVSESEEEMSLNLSKHTFNDLRSSFNRSEYQIEYPQPPPSDRSNLKKEMCKKCPKIPKTALFPSAGCCDTKTQAPGVCVCTKERPKRRSPDLTKRNLKMYTKVEADCKSVDLSRAKEISKNPLDNCSKLDKYKFEKKFKVGPPKEKIKPTAKVVDRNSPNYCCKDMIKLDQKMKPHFKENTGSVVPSPGKENLSSPTYALKDSENQIKNKSSKTDNDENSDKYKIAKQTCFKKDCCAKLSKIDLEVHPNLSNIYSPDANGKCCNEIKKIRTALPKLALNKPITSSTLTQRNAIDNHGVKGEIIKEIKVCECGVEEQRTIKRKPRPYPIIATTTNIYDQVKSKFDGNPVAALMNKAVDIVKLATTDNPVETVEEISLQEQVEAKPSMDKWENDHESYSEFSDSFEQREACTIDGNNVTTKLNKDLPFLRSYVNKGELCCKEDAREHESEESVWSYPEPISNVSSTQWDEAWGCNKDKTCPRRLPPGSEYRHYHKKEEKDRLERYHKKKERLQKEISLRYQQWHPPGRHPLQNIFHADSNIFNSDSSNVVLNPSEYDPDTKSTVENLIVTDTSESFTTANTQAERMYPNKVNSMDKLASKVSKYPILRREDKLQELRQFLDETCDMHKLPRFACCRLHNHKWEAMKDNKSLNKNRVYANLPLSCLCNSHESLSGDFYTAPQVFRKPHSVCSECHIEIGTQQRPPCRRYLLPLKAVRCYEDALVRHGEAPSSDSGLSLQTAVDVVHSSDDSAINPNQKQVLLDLMGLSTGQGTKLKTPLRKISPSGSLFSISAFSSASSGVCCHANTARQLPLLHLQGLGCDLKLKQPSENPYPIEWWKSHYLALKTTQSCVDECVRLRVLVAQNRQDAMTEHEKTCKVCGPKTWNVDRFPPFDGTDLPVPGMVLGPRYSEMLPLVWQPSVRHDGSVPTDKGQARACFYREIIEATIESTRFMTLTPDIGSNNKKDELTPELTAMHMARLAVFRQMIKSLNEVLGKIIPLKKANIVTDKDVNQLVDLQQTDDDVKQWKENEEKHQNKLSILQALNNFVKERLGGSVSDCREVLEAPWELPINQQQLAGKYLANIVDALGVIDDSENPTREYPLDGALQASIKAFLNDALFQATTQTCIKQVVKQATIAKQHFAFVDVITRLCAAKLVRFSEIVEASIKNTRRVVKGCLVAVKVNENEEEFNEEWWNNAEGSINVKAHVSSMLHKGRDESNSTIDDVIIGFEKLRRYVRQDLTLSNGEVNSICDLKNEVAMRLFKGIVESPPPRIKPPSYAAWTESEVVLKENLKVKKKVCESDQGAKKLDFIDQDMAADKKIKCSDFIDQDMAADKKANPSDFIDQDMASDGLDIIEDKEVGALMQSPDKDSVTTFNRDYFKDEHAHDTAVDDENVKKSNWGFWKRKLKKPDKKDKTKVKKTVKKPTLIDQPMNYDDSGKIETKNDSYFTEDCNTDDSVILQSNQKFFGGGKKNKNLNPSAGTVQSDSSHIYDVINHYTCSDVQSTDAYQTCASNFQSTSYSEAYSSFPSQQKIEGKEKCPIMKPNILDSTTSDSSFTPIAKPKKIQNRRVRIQSPPYDVMEECSVFPSCGEVIKTKPLQRVGGNMGGFANQVRTVQRAHKMAEDKKKHRFEDVFDIAEEGETTETKDALKGKKGKNMLQEIFGEKLTAKEMVARFHGNVRSLVNNQSGNIFPHWTSAVAQTILLAIAMASLIYSLCSALVFGIHDYLLLSAIPISIATFGLILEPIKCGTVAWVLFLRNKKPAFHNSPLFIKSSADISRKITSLKPRNPGYLNRQPEGYFGYTSPQAIDYEDTLYRIYCENKARPGLGGNRRRWLPALGESDVSLDLEEVEPYNELDQATQSAASQLMGNDAVSGFRRMAIDMGNNPVLPTKGMRRFGMGDQGYGEMKRKIDSPNHNDSSSISDDSSIKLPLNKTKIVWCSYATEEDGRPASDITNSDDK